jgi:hypothetical protein
MVKCLEIFDTGHQEAGGFTDFQLPSWSGQFSTADHFLLSV